jgi:uncharacterized membrane protein
MAKKTKSNLESLKSLNEQLSINGRVDKIVVDYRKKVGKQIDKEYKVETRWPDRLADKIASFGGSWKFIIFFALFLVTWMVYNSLPFIKHFDSKPFILLNLILSFIAAFQAPVILMSQNRQAARDKEESMVDFAINYRAEQEANYTKEEIRKVYKKLEEIENKLQK